MDFWVGARPTHNFKICSIKFCASLLESILIYFRCEHIVSKLLTPETQKMLSPYFITRPLYPYVFQIKNVDLKRIRILYLTVFYDKFFFFQNRYNFIWVSDKQSAKLLYRPTQHQIRWKMSRISDIKYGNIQKVRLTHNHLRFWGSLCSKYITVQQG
jgi:hypothetical protein